MLNAQKHTYEEARIRAQEAFQACIEGERFRAQELLLLTRNELKHLSGDLPIVGHNRELDDRQDTPFATQIFVEAQAWGWLEFATGVFQMVKERPGSALVNFKRAWRIWRPWVAEGEGEAQRLEARRERIRASLWLGEAWARIMSDRAPQMTAAVFRAALTDLARFEDKNLLQETISQQKHLPAAALGSLAYNTEGQNVPYVCLFIAQ
jgi:hypothetical protein